jgi:hypothetical protein
MPARFITLISVVLPHASSSGATSKELLDALFALGLCCGALVEQHRQNPQQQILQQQQMSEFLSRALAIIDAYALSFGGIIDLLLHVRFVKLLTQVEAICRDPSHYVSQLGISYEATGFPSKSLAAASRGLAKLQVSMWPARVQLSMMVPFFR